MSARASAAGTDFPAFLAPNIAVPLRTRMRPADLTTDHGPRHYPIILKDATLRVHPQASSNEFRDIISSRMRTIAHGLLILCCFAIPSTSKAVFKRGTQQLQRSDECKTQGDGDLYGIGVRLGIYLQWASGFILRNIGSWELVSRVRTTSNVLCSALALAAAINI